MPRKETVPCGLTTSCHVLPNSFILHMQNKVTKEQIDSFLSGHDPMERIIKLEISYDEDKVRIFHRDTDGLKKCLIEPFYPFVWTKQVTARNLFGGDRKTLKKKMSEYGIGCKGLVVEDGDGNIHPRMENGYRVMFFARVPMPFNKFMDFFTEGGRPIYPKETDKTYGIRDYIVVAPNEQHMISTGKRLFKGYDDYNDSIRLLWDLETEGLNPETDMISQIGLRTNHGFEKIIKITGNTREEKSDNELKGLKEMFIIISEIDPDVMSGHNTENFDWYFVDVRLQKHGSSLQAFTSSFFGGRGIYKKKKQAVLKLGGEMEYYFPTIKYGTNITDSLHAVRRAQAIDSNMKKADLKYVTKYSKLNKPNRVYVPGKIINETWADGTYNYAHNDKNGHWFKIEWENVDRDSQEGGNRYYTVIVDGKEILTDRENDEKFDIVTGTYIVERYLLDDLDETDKVELRYNQPNFLVGKMLPVSFDKMCTMGTAAIWKYIMLAWSYEHDLAIPELVDTRKFTGGLSRLLSVGFVDRIVKLDYNSLYPSIILSYDIKSPVDISCVMNALLEYILTQREYYKGLKGDFGKKADKLRKQIEADPNNPDNEELRKEQLRCEAEAAKNDKMQLPLKIIGNGFFGSFGSGAPFPHTTIECAEMTTCIGRACLRLMISHFANLGYKPIVGDSFTGDTPLFIKYNDTGMIDIKPISELIDGTAIETDALGREYDYSAKPYKVLCRSGWVEPSYIYRHVTDKPIYTVSEDNMMVEVTEDHSLFNDKQEKIKPSEITSGTKLEFYEKDIIVEHPVKLQSYKDIVELVSETINCNLQKIPMSILNANPISQKIFVKLLEDRIRIGKISGYDVYSKKKINFKNITKTFVAGLNYLKR